jgi:hypothetical protein
MKQFSKFGSKQDVDCLNTAEVKAHQWEGIPSASGSPHVCNEYPSAAFHCPTLAHFKCGPKTYDPLVRHFFSAFVTHNVDGNDVIFYPFLQVRMVKCAYVSFIDKPVDENMQCTLHNENNPLHKHWGAILRKGMSILVDATECELVDGYVYYMAARVLTTTGRKGCKVGIVKCLFDQVEYFAHRSPCGLCYQNSTFRQTNATVLQGLYLLTVGKQNTIKLKTIMKSLVTKTSRT